MNKLYLCLILAAATMTASAQINLKKVKTEVEKRTGTTNKALTNDEIIKGLKEALSLGTNKAGSTASKLDGYYKNPALFIPFPPEANKAKERLIQLGYGKKVEEFTKTLNRAAEKAATDAAPIFLDAIKQLTITDGLNILNGSNDAATRYLNTKTNSALTAKFKPIIDKALSEVSATKYWTDLTKIYNKLPKVKKVNTDLAAYTTERAIVGLFKLIADEEAKIRKDPAAQVTDLLKKVFGKK